MKLWPLSKYLFFFLCQHFHFAEFFPFILQSLAKFHALCIGMRRQEPELFNSRVSPFLEAVNMITDDNDTRMVDVNIQMFKF